MASTHGQIMGYGFDGGANWIGSAVRCSLVYLGGPLVDKSLMGLKGGSVLPFYS